MRGELEVGAKELPEPLLRSLWVSLDDDGSGFITAKGARTLGLHSRPAPCHTPSDDTPRLPAAPAEFGHFMKRGAPEAVKLTNLERRRLLGVQMRASLEQEKAEIMERELRKATEQARAHAAEKAQLQAELEALSSFRQVGDAKVFVGRLKKATHQKRSTAQ